MATKKAAAAAAKKPAASPAAIAQHQPAADPSAPKPHKTWSGFLTFGLINMPIALYTGSREERISFNQLHDACMARVKQPDFMVCGACEAQVPKESLVKGYEISEGQFVQIKPEDLDAIAPESSKTLEIQQFIPAAELDPMYFESSYYLAPTDGGHRAFALIQQAMVARNVVALARWCKTGREHLVAIRPYRAGLMVHTMFWSHEIRQMEFPILSAAPEAELTMAGELIDVLTDNFQPTQYKDGYREAVLGLIEKLKTGEKITPAAPVKRAPVVDIVSSLAQSVTAARARKKSTAA